MKKCNLFMLVALLVACVSCSKDESESPKMASIENIAYTVTRDKVEVTWDAVEGAFAYQVYINDEAASSLPVAYTRFSAGELEDGVTIKIEAYNNIELTNVFATGELTYVAPEKPVIGTVEDIELTWDENLGYFVRYKQFEGATHHRIYVNDKLTIDNVASDYMRLEEVVKFDTIRVDAWDATAEAVIATGKAVIGEFDPDPVVGLSYEPRDQEVTLKWEAPRGGYTDIVIFDGDRTEGANKIAEVAKGTNEVVITGLKNHTSQYLYVYAYNSISEKYNEKFDYWSVILVRAKPEDQIDLFGTTWKMKDDANSKLEFSNYKEDAIIVSDYTVHPPVQGIHTVYEFDYSTNQGKILETDYNSLYARVTGGAITYDPDTEILTYLGVDYKQKWE